MVTHGGGMPGQSAVCLFSPVLAIIAYGRLTEEYYGPVFAILILLLPSACLLAALVRLLLGAGRLAAAETTQPISGRLLPLSLRRFAMAFLGLVSLTMGLILEFPFRLFTAH